MGSNPFVLQFDQISEFDIPLVGSKGLHLAEMFQAGLPVLPGFCVTTSAYRAFLSDNGLDPAVAQNNDVAVREILAGNGQLPPLPAVVSEAIAEAYEELGARTVAVRSSATAEDKQDVSFAGQYDTFLNVAGADAVLESVRDCWAALWNDRVQAYMQEQGLSPLDAHMGVVVQRQGDAQAAGVLFTLNPLTGREEEMVVEAAWGQGEAVVSGRVTPDHYVIDVRAGEVTERNISNQSVVLVAGEEDGLVEKPLSSEKHDQSVLSDEQLLELTGLGHQVQAIYGYPQDIEWALVDHQFVLLQSRPLTSFSFDQSLGQWTSGNYREVLPGFASPLSLSLSLEHDYGRAFTEFFELVGLGAPPEGTVWGQPFFGRAYWNVGIAKQMTSARLPGFKERVFDRTAGIEPTYEGDGIVTPWSPGVAIRAVPLMLNLNRQYKEVWRSAHTYRDQFLNETEPSLDEIQPEKLSNQELADYCRRMADLHWEANGMAIRVSLLSAQAQDDFEPMVSRLNSTLPADQRVAEGDLITGLSGVRTAQPTLELWKLARAAAATPDVLAAVTRGNPEGIPDRLITSEAGLAFWDEIQGFIKRYRYMASIDEDLIEARWDEDSIFVLSTLQAYAAADETVDPMLRVETQRKARRATEHRTLKILSRGWRRAWPFGRRQFINQLRLVRRYVWWREETRVIAARAYYHCRRIYKELGRRWAESGILEEVDHIFMLRWPDILAVLDGDSDPACLRQRVEDYLLFKHCYRNFEPPSVIGRGSTSLQRRVAAPASGQKQFTGIPCSSGKVEGAARVVENLEEARGLQRGEILVARYTNPGWTPLFNLAGGIIIEEGGLLSHGAVVAREYGVPAVLRIEGATQIFQTGQRLRIDGGTGVVEIL